MKKMLIIGVILTGLLLLAGCGEQSQDIGPSKTPFVGGTTALSLEFVEGAPPLEIFDNNQFPFSINLKIENLGEDDVETDEGYIEITGIRAEDFGLAGQSNLKQDLPYDVSGVVKNFQGIVLVGDTIITEFNDLNYDQDLSGNWDGPRIRANLCYNYETKATTFICLKRDLLTNIDTKEICDLSGDKEVFNSGAPIQVTAVSQTPGGSDKIQVQFEISHVGDTNDRFYKLDTECDDKSTNTDKDKVYFKVADDVNGNSAECSGLESGSTSDEGYVTLYNGKPRTVVCTIDVSNVEGVYEIPLGVELSYRYYQFIEKTILIKDVSTGDDE